MGGGRKKKKEKRKLVIRPVARFTFVSRNVLSYLSRLRPCAFARKENCTLSFERGKIIEHRDRKLPRIYPKQRKQRRGTR